MAYINQSLIFKYYTWHWMIFRQKFKTLPSKTLNAFLQLGRGHLAELDFLKFSFRFKYSIGKKDLVELLRSTIIKSKEYMY